MPSFNDANYIEQAIRSVLEQDYEHLELIIADGESTDGTVDVIEKYGHGSNVRWNSQKDTGPFQAVNRALMMARGDLIAIQSANDAYHLGAITEMVQEFIKEPRLAFMGGWTETMDANGVPTGQMTMLHSRMVDYSVDNVVNLTGGYPRGQATMFRRDVALSIGGFREDAPNHGIFYLHYILEATRRGALSRAVPKVWALYRHHTNQRHVENAVNLLAFLNYRSAHFALLAAQYNDILNPKQTRLLLRSGYYPELRYRFTKHENLGPTIVLAWKYAKVGGVIDLVSKLGLRLRRTRHSPKS